MNPPFGHVLRQLNAVHPTTPNFFHARFNITNVGTKEMQPVFYPKFGAN
jgi:hypothetical protein